MIASVLEILLKLAYGISSVVFLSKFILAFFPHLHFCYWNEPIRDLIAGMSCFLLLVSYSFSNLRPVYWILFIVLVLTNFFLGFALNKIEWWFPGDEVGSNRRLH